MNENELGWKVLFIIIIIIIAALVVYVIFNFDEWLAEDIIIEGPVKVTDIGEYSDKITIITKDSKEYRVDYYNTDLKHEYGEIEIKEGDMLNIIEYQILSKRWKDIKIIKSEIVEVN